MGIELVDDGTGKVFRAYRDHYKWNCGIALRDWRYAVRICNVDVSDLIADTDGTTVKLIENMIRAVHRIPNLKMGRAAFYMNRTIRECLDIQAMNKRTFSCGSMSTTVSSVPACAACLSAPSMPCSTPRRQWSKTAGFPRS